MQQSESKFDWKKLFANPPMIHTWQGLDETTFAELSRRLKPGMTTLETGAGLSTIVFTANGCKHTCIMPEITIADSIKEYCQSTKIETKNLQFILSKSCDIIHQLKPSSYDLILIDGCHGFPSVFVDFCYATKLLKTGGVLIIDDMHIYTCYLIAQFMQSDRGWKMDVFSERVAIGTKIEETIDDEWTSQRFVILRSRGSSILRHPLLFSKTTIKAFAKEGPRATMKKIIRRTFGR